MSKRKSMSTNCLTRICILITLSLFVSHSYSFAQKYSRELKDNIGIDQKLGQQIPPDLTFTDEAGNVVRLGDYFGVKPIIVTLVYYDCPMLCNQVLTSLLRAMNVLAFGIGTEFDVLTVSVDPEETHELAAEKREEYLSNYHGRDGSNGWYFLTGQQDQIKQLASAVGFRYEYEEQTDQYIHASGIMVLTPEGKLSRYFYGIDYPPRDLRWGLVEAADGAIGSVVDQLLLMCYSYDPMTGKYGLYIRNSLRISAVATVVAIGSFIVVMLRRERRGEFKQPQSN